MIIDCAHYLDGRDTAFARYGLGSLVVPLGLLFWWLRLGRAGTPADAAGQG